MKKLSDCLNAAYKKLCISESDVGSKTVQKALRLFGYPNASEQKYICCANESPRVDIHSYKIAGKNFIMCLITSPNREVIDSGLWTMVDNAFKTIDRNTFISCKTLNDIDTKINEISNGMYKMIMHY